MTHKHESPGDVAKRIKEWLGPNGRENTASLLLYEAMLALKGVAHAQAHVRPVGTLKVLDRSKHGYLTKIVYTHGAPELPDGRYDLYTHPAEASASALSKAYDEGWKAALPGLSDADKLADMDTTAYKEQKAEAIARACAANAAEPAHPDDVAVDLFAAAMKEKLAQAREKGRGGWQQCDPVELSIMLREHVEKADPRDVANFCMFLWNLGKPISDAALPYGKRAAQHQAEPQIERYCKRCGGEGVIHTGIAEASSTQCTACNGTGLDDQAQPRADERRTFELEVCKQWTPGF